MKKLCFQVFPKRPVLRRTRGTSMRRLGGSSCAVTTTNASLSAKADTSAVASGISSFITWMRSRRVGPRRRRTSRYFAGLTIFIRGSSSLGRADVRRERGKKGPHSRVSQSGSGAPRSAADLSCGKCYRGQVLFASTDLHELGCLRGRLAFAAPNAAASSARLLLRYRRTRNSPLPTRAVATIALSSQCAMVRILRAFRLGRR